MVKIYCEACEGRKRINVCARDEVHDSPEVFEQCPDCQGKGYTENTELECLVRIGEATKKAFGENTNTCVLFIDSVPNTEECFEYELTSIEDLLEWADKAKFKT